MKIEAPKLYQKFHEREVEVKSITWKDGDIESITTLYPNSAPSVITYYNKDDANFKMKVDDESVFELSDLITLDQTYVKERLGDLDYYFNMYEKSRELLESILDEGLTEGNKEEIKAFLDETECKF